VASRAGGPAGRRATPVRLAGLALALLALALLAAGCAGEALGQSAATRTPAENGRLLFRNKGCVYCHLNTRVPGQEGEMAGYGPDLSSYRNDPEFLRRCLADPGSVRPGTAMPDLDLRPAEIEDLIAFLNE
jgi:cytochrome c2